MAEATRSRRPQAVIDTEVVLTRQAVRICDRLVTVALAERRNLLADGWPDTHSLCEALDQVALRWTGERDAQARALRKLLAEYGPAGAPGVGATPAEDDQPKDQP